MCFSASASFASSAVLVTIGAVSITKSRTAPQRFLACMPLLFAFQQLCEGFVWLSVIDPTYAHWQHMAMYSFLFIAQVGWPFYIPLSVYFIEKNKKRRKILKWFVGAGLLATVYFSWCLIAFKANIVVNPYHIKYELDFPFVKRWFYGLMYFIPAMLPTFFSSNKRMNLLGALLFTSYLISRLCYRDYIVSVWCFFGALSSITALFIILQLREQESRRVSFR